MNANDLRPEQARAVIDGTTPTLDYLTRLVARMDAQGWRPDCPAYVAALRTRDGLRELRAGLEHPGPPDLPRWAWGERDGA